MRKIAASYIFPGTSPPIKFGIIYVDEQNRITKIKDNGGVMIEEEGCEFYSGIIIPGLVNAHTHLELSYLKGIYKPNTGMLNFLETMFNKPYFEEKQIETAIQQADRQMYLNGISVVGDICNTAATINIKKQSRIVYKSFVELSGLDSALTHPRLIKGISIVEEYRKHNLHASLTPHSSYSVNSKLLQKIAQSKYSNIQSIHTLENPICAETLTDSPQSFKAFFKNKGILKGNTPTQELHPYLFVLKQFCDKTILLVHNTFSTAKDWEIALNEAKSNNLSVFAVTCPRSNAFINSTLPDYEQWSNNVQICIGTDSLASNSDLSVFEEMKYILKHTPVAFDDVLTWGTINGAKAMGIDNVYGSLDVDKTPGLNLIEDFDFKKMTLSESSKIRRLI